MTSVVKQAMPPMLMQKAGIESKGARGRAPQADFAEALGIGKQDSSKKSATMKADGGDPVTAWPRLATKLESAFERVHHAPLKAEADGDGLDEQLGDTSGDDASSTRTGRSRCRWNETQSSRAKFTCRQTGRRLSCPRGRIHRHRTSRSLSLRRATKHPASLRMSKCHLHWPASRRRTLLQTTLPCRPTSRRKRQRRLRSCLCAPAKEPSRNSPNLLRTRNRP